MGLGALLALLLCGMYFCSLQAANEVTKCNKADANVCGFFDILIQKEGLGPTGIILRNIRGSPVSY